MTCGKNEKEFIESCENNICLLLKAIRRIFKFIYMNRKHCRLMNKILYNLKYQIYRVTLVMQVMFLI